jgi:hypothetical protein
MLCVRMCVHSQAGSHKQYCEIRQSQMNAVFISQIAMHINTVSVIKTGCRINGVKNEHDLV